MEKKKRAYGYIRVSTMMQAEDGISLETQTNKIKRHCKYKNYKLKRVFVDGGISGGTSNRPALQEMLSLVKKDEYIICADLSRLSRNSKDAINIITDLQSKGSYLVSLEPDIDFSTATGEAFSTILFAFYQLERKQISARVKSNMQTLCEQGILRPKPPFGLKFISKDLPFETDEDQAKVIPYILQLYDEGVSLSKISIMLNEEGYAIVLKNYQEGQQFYPQTVKNILADQGKIEVSWRKPYGEKYFESRKKDKS